MIRHVIRKAEAVGCDNGRAGSGGHSSDSGVLAGRAYSFRIRFENETWANLEELIAAAHAGCFAIALELRLQGTGDAPTELNSEAVVIARLTRGAGQPHADSLIQRFERWARWHLARGFSLDGAAKALATSKRTLARRMQNVLGTTPLDFFQDLRIERAVHLLRTGHASVDQIAAKVGYANGMTLRALLRRKLRRGVGEIRRSQ